MELIGLLIIICSAQIEFVSPDELLQKNISYRVAPFGNPWLYKGYGKLLLFEIKSDCLISSETIKSIKADTLLTVYSATKYCDPSEIAYMAQINGALGTIFVWDDFDYPGNIFSQIKVYPYRGPYASQVRTLCVFIDKDLGDLIKTHSKKTIIITYQMQRSDSPYAPNSIYLDSNYSTDIQYIESLKYFTGKNSLSINEFKIYLLYTKNSNNTFTDCYESKYNKLYCLPSSLLASGRDRIINSILILNYFYQVENITKFYEYYKDLVSACSNNYLVECNSKILNSRNEQPNFDDAILLYSLVLYQEMIPSAILNKVSCYSPYLCFQMYSLAFKNNYTSSINNCSFSLQHHSGCDTACNNSYTGYDNLKCLESNKCYSFMLGDNNCNNECDYDPDCSGVNLLLIKILVPIVAFFSILALCFIIFKKLKYRKKLEFDTIDYTKDLSHQGDPVCTLDLLQIDEGMAIVFLKDSCKHIFHKKCYATWKMSNPEAICPTCIADLGRIELDI